MPISPNDHATFSTAHDRYLDPPNEPECECHDANNEPVDHESCEDEDCKCPLHKHYDPRDEPEYYEGDKYYD